MKNIVKVKGHANLIKDQDQNVVINTDTNSFALYKMKREKLIEAKEKEQELEKKVETLESDMQDIKTLLGKIATALNV